MQGLGQHMIVVDTSHAERVWEKVAKFGASIELADVDYACSEGFGDFAARAKACLGWIWMQWLSNDDSRWRSFVEAFVERGLKIREVSGNLNARGLHDLYLLHCAVYGCSHEMIVRAAEGAVDGVGHGQNLQNNGEVYVYAWVGMLKHWILKDLRTAETQFQSAKTAFIPESLKAAQPWFVEPWLRGNWRAFRTAQRRDFRLRWINAKKNRAIQQKNRDIIVDIERAAEPIDQRWCWAHAGLALLAHNDGIEVETDEFWFPRKALVKVEREAIS